MRIFGKVMSADCATKLIKAHSGSFRVMNTETFNKKKTQKHTWDNGDKIVDLDILQYTLCLSTL